ncbi:MAG: F-type H+-transporting ATPase subunit b [Gammaproteobacteria bacterium]|jgi:F-type H+-transporting ATPase subunit b
MNINLTLFGQTVTFIVFVWFCMTYVWPPILNALNERRQKIADGLAEAEKGMQAKAVAEKDAARALQDAKSQATEILSQAQRRADEIVGESKQTARVEGERLLTGARAEIDQEVNRAREDLRKEVIAIALRGTEQLLGREVDQAAHNDLLENLAGQL